jgi:predicted ArsR family transcriptional regulator
MKAGRGDFKKEIARKNREIIRAYLEKNPDKTLTDCKNDTGLAYATVRKHLDAIKKEQPTATTTGKS